MFSLRANGETPRLAKLTNSLHEATADGSAGPAEYFCRLNVQATVFRNRSLHEAHWTRFRLHRTSDRESE